MTWERIKRVGSLQVKPTKDRPGSVDVKFRTAPSNRQDEWTGYFEQKAVDLDLNVRFYGFGMDGDDGLLLAPVDDFEAAVGLLDQALDFANDEYEQNDLPAVVAKQKADSEVRDAALRQQSDLDARAAKLERPNATR